MSIIDQLPIDAARHRILGSADAAQFWGVSLAPLAPSLSRREGAPSRAE